MKKTIRSTLVFCAKALGVASFLKRIRMLYLFAHELPGLRDRVEYLYYENSDIRSALRHLVAAKLDSIPQYATESYDSFDYQWGNLPLGNDLLTDPAFKATVTEQIVKYCGLPAEWFKGKKVLDAGSGNGRFSYGLALLGAEVTSVDLSKSGIASAKKSMLAEPEIGKRVEFHQKNLLQPLEMPQQFDLVWSFGVLHHTGDTFKGFHNVVETLKPGGYLFLMLYGEPEWSDTDQFNELNLYWSWRRQLRHLSTPERVEKLSEAYKATPHVVHGMFDAVSPPVNDLYTESELRTWLKSKGFTDVVRPFANRNIFLRGTLTNSPRPNANRGSEKVLSTSEV